MPESLRPIGYLTGLNQGWTMFAPRPYVSTHWYVIPGTLRDGRQFDLTEAVVRDEASLAKPVSWERPSDMNEVFADKYWRKYLDDMEENGTLRRSFAAFVCRTWNADHGGPDKLVSLEVVQVSERTLPNRAHEMAERDVVVERTCD